MYLKFCILSKLLLDLLYLSSIVNAQKLIVYFGFTEKKNFAICQIRETFSEFS